MEKLDIFNSLIKSLLYFILAFALLGSLYEYQPLGPMVKFIIALLAMIEAIRLIRKIDNRHNSDG